MKQATVSPSAGLNAGLRSVEASASAAFFYSGA